MKIPMIIIYVRDLLFALFFKIYVGSIYWIRFFLRSFIQKFGNRNSFRKGQQFHIGSNITIFSQRYSMFNFVKLCLCKCWTLAILKLLSLIGVMGSQGLCDECSLLSYDENPLKLKRRCDNFVRAYATDVTITTTKSL